MKLEGINESNLIQPVKKITPIEKKKFEEKKPGKSFAELIEEENKEDEFIRGE